MSKEALMPEAEKPGEPGTPENIWKSQEREEPTMQIALTASQLCAMSRSRERLTAFLFWAVAAVMAALAGAALYNVYTLDQPWIRVGQAWALGVIVYLVAPALHRGPARMGASEPCAHFLESQHEERRRGYLWIRRRLFLLIPAMVASWWGGGPLAQAKARGLSPSSWLYRFCAGPWPFLVAGAALILVWFAFGKAAEKAFRDAEEIRRSIEC
jgi:hypothetical protein